MADIWTTPTNWNTGTDFTEAKAENEITNNMDVLALAVDGDTSASTIKHRHRSGTYATLLTIAAGEAGRLYDCTDFDCYFKDDGVAWQPLPGMRGRNCDVFEDDFWLTPSGVWTPTNGVGATQVHRSDGSSTWQLSTGNTASNQSSTLVTPINWGVFSTRAPAWFECRIKDDSASRIQQELVIGLANAGSTDGVFFNKVCAGSEVDWTFRVRAGGVDHNAGAGTVMTGTTGSGLFIFRFVVEAVLNGTANIKVYNSNTLVATLAGVTRPGSALQMLIKSNNTENAVKALAVDRVLMLSKRS